MWYIIATFVAFFVKGLCGFANSLIFSSVLGFTMDNKNISPVELVLGYPGNMIIAYKERKHIQWKICLPLVVLVLCGSLPGAFMLKNASAENIKIFFGIIIILLGVEMLLRERSSKKKNNSKWLLLTIGVVSGLLFGLYGIGALLAAYVGRVTEDTREFKANLTIVFLIENTFRIILYSCIGIITLDVVKQAVLLMPVMVIGILCGMKSSDILDEKLVKKIVIVALIVSGAALIINNL